MLPKRWSGFYAALAVVLFASAPDVRAESAIYQFYQGGVNGVLEAQFTFDPNTPQPQGNGGPPVPTGWLYWTGTFQNYLGFTGSPLEPFFYMKPGIENGHISLIQDPPFAASYYMRADTLSPITGPGTYPLFTKTFTEPPVGLAVPNYGSQIEVSDEILSIGSYIPLDTLVVSAPSVPEPTTFTLLGVGMAIMGLCCIRRGRCHW